MCLPAFWNVTEDEGAVLLRYVRNYIASNTVSHPRDLNLQATLPSTTSRMTGSGFHLPVKMEAAGTSAMLALTHQTAQHNSPEDSNIQSLL